MNAKKIALVVLVALAMFAVLVACGTPATPAAPQVVKETVVVEKPVQQTVVVEKQVQQTVVVQPTAAPVTGNTLPRNETMYFNGQQWGAVVCWNPYSSNCNNAMAINQQDSARVTMFETPYLFDMLDGKVYPLLADGDYKWDDKKTTLTFKLKPAAKWSDGTPVTADDVAYTWATHLKYNTPTGASNKDYIDTITAVDPQTVAIKAKLGADGSAVNPLLVQAYVSTN